MAQYSAVHGMASGLSMDIRTELQHYVKNKDKLGTGNVSGILLYAKTAEELTPDNDYCIGGNKFGVKTLDLNTNWSEIKSQLDSLPEYYLI